LKEELEVAKSLLTQLHAESNSDAVKEIHDILAKEMNPGRKEIVGSLRRSLRLVRNQELSSKSTIINWLEHAMTQNHDRYSSYLYSESDSSALKVPHIPAVFTDREDDGRIILRDNFDKIFEKHPEVLTFGEDTGKIGGVNQTMEGMQEKYGSLRVSDTGIRELTILGQGIGMAMRGLRPIAEIQYLDYLLYCIQIMSDDLATVQYRTKGGQKAPLIVRTRGHRLEGIWHSGSPMGMIINSIRGMYVCVPRNLTKAAGFYNTLIKGDDAALVIEPLNGYRTKEKYPENLGEFNEPLGIPEITQEGTDITMVSYGSTFNLCTKALAELEALNVSIELIDIQTFIPFDINNMIVGSLKKTNRLMIVDEDVSSGGSAFILDNVMTCQKG
jgi:pyruvate/2-oxoglutarate/acetoin dehydrogenase E1 component